MASRPGAEDAQRPSIGSGAAAHSPDREFHSCAISAMIEANVANLQGEADRVVDEELSRAVMVYLRGNGIGRPPEAVARELGAEAAKRVEPRLKQLAREAVYWPVDWQKHNDVSAMRAVEHEIAEEHPELNADAVRALALYFSFCNR
jgi:hypothetical protein